MTRVRFFSIVLIFVYNSLFNISFAVLKEQDLEHTLSVLCAELEQSYAEQKANIKYYESMSKLQHEKLIDLMKHADQVALMLYSQKSDFSFDIAYACQEATEQYQLLHKTHVPFDEFENHLSQEISRYNGLIEHLSSIPPRVVKNDSADVARAFTEQLDSLTIHPFFLSPKEQIIRSKCIFYATELRDNFTNLSVRVSADRSHYEHVAGKIDSLNAFAMTKYEQLQKNIFVNGGDNYISTLSMFRLHFRQAKQDASDKYFQLREGENVSPSDWRGPIILWVTVFILFYIIIASVLSNLILRYAIPKKWRSNPTFQQKRPILILSCGVGIFALVVGGVALSIHQNFILMATGLMVNFAWLFLAILVSLLVRIHGDSIRAALNQYLPFLWMSFIVIVFRIILIPNNIVNIIYPPLLALFTLWQYVVLRSRRKTPHKIPQSDIFYSAFSLVVMVVSCVVAWIGYTLLAVQIMIWWTFQLAAIQTITCLFDIIGILETRFSYDALKQSSIEYSQISETDLHRKIREGEFIQITWLTDFIERAAIPVMAVLSVLMSIYWAADIFDMTAICRKIFLTDFVDEDGLIRISLFKICIVVAAWFIFRYFGYLLRSLYRLYKKKNSPNANTQYNISLANNVISILAWGIYFIFILVLLQVPKSGISIVTAGLATGMGFAMKDLLENFFYGISLMTGRVRVGDYIECDGILGKVESISYQSTQIVTLDGSIIAFLNATLFTKNFKNLTRNHSYILEMIPIGIAYGTDIAHVRNILSDTLQALRKKLPDGRDVIESDKSIDISFHNFGDSCINLWVKIWCLVDQKIRVVAEAQEIIYDTLNRHHIEIPFPQRDIHIIQNHVK